MILNRELMHNKRRINLDKKIRKLTALAHEVLDEGKNPDERGIG